MHLMTTGLEMFSFSCPLFIYIMRLVLTFVCFYKKAPDSRSASPVGANMAFTKTNLHSFHLLILLSAVARANWNYAWATAVRPVSWQVLTLKKKLVLWTKCDILGSCHGYIQTNKVKNVMPWVSPDAGSRCCLGQPKHTVTLTVMLCSSKQITVSISRRATVSVLCYAILWLTARRSQFHIFACFEVL